MLMMINLVASAIIWAGSIWAVLTHKVPTRTGGALVLLLVNFAALGNMVSTKLCHSEPEVLLNVAFAFGVLWGIWRLELRQLMKGKPA